ncbi:MAG: PEGA domain-containing protein [Acidobacteria bacterium]|nr:MAG: PEGA domain-containing protein [Acidobacteriota bacterium]
MGRLTIKYLVLPLLLLQPLLAKGTQYGVVIGISEYRHLNEELWLEYAHSDARAFSDFLKSRFVNVPPGNLSVMLNEAATTVNIRTAFGKLLKNSTEEDIVYIYIATHGTIDRELDAAFLVTHDTVPDNLYGTAYPMSEFQYLYQNLKAKHLIVISDACKSGNIGADVRGLRRDIGEEEVVVNEYFKDILKENKGIKSSQFIYAAAGARESSIEDADIGGGIFTKSLIDALQGAADSNRDQKVTAAEAHSYVYNRVREYTKGLQNPMIINDSQYDGNLVLSVTDPSTSSPESAAVEPRVRAPEPGLAAAPAPARTTSSARTSEPGVSAAFATLTIESVEGAEVRVNRSVVGTTTKDRPLVVTLAPGTYVVEARKPDFEDYREELTLAAEQRLTRTLPLRPIAGAVPWMAKYREAMTAYGNEEAGATAKLQEAWKAIIADGKSRPLSADETQALQECFVTCVDARADKSKWRDFPKMVADYMQVSWLLPAPAEFLDADWYRDEIAKYAAAVTIETRVPGVDLRFGELPPEKLNGVRQLIVRPGSYDVFLTKPRYAPKAVRLELTPGVLAEPVKFDGQLESLDVIAITTQPVEAGVAGLKIQARPLGEVFNRLDQNIRSAVESVIKKNSLNYSDVRVILAEGLDPKTASYTFEFTRPAFETEAVKLDLNEATLASIHLLDGRYVLDHPIRLQPMTGELIVSSFPPSAAVLIDRQAVGTTPFSARLPIGNHSLKLKHPTAGVYVEQLDMKRNDSHRIEAHLKPLLVYVGILPTAEVKADKLAEADQILSARVKTLANSFLIDFQPAAKYEFWDAVLKSMFGNQPKETASHLPRIAERFDSRLIVFGAFRSMTDFLSNKVHLYLMNTASPWCDSWPVDLRTFEGLEQIGKIIDQGWQVEKHFWGNWTGLKLVDTILPGQNLIVAGIYGGSPAEQAGIKQGDAILLVDGQQRSSRDFYTYVAERQPGDKISISTVDGAKTLTVEQRPVLLNSDLLFNNSTLFALERIQAENPVASLPHQLAILDSAICHMRFKNWQLAVEQLNRLDLGQIPHFTATVSYLLGRCFEALGEKQQAIRFYEKCREARTETMGLEYSESPAELAVWRLESIG